VVMVGGGGDSPKRTLQQVEVNRSDQHWSEVSKTWRDDRSWRMGGISVLKCCPGSRLGYERGRAEGEQSAGVCPKLSWLWGGRRAVNGRKVEPLD
jgi:hypothetical protein